MAEMVDFKHNFVLTLHEVLQRDNSLSRWCAIKALERIAVKDHDSQQKLIDSLLDPDSDVRMEAAQALGRLKVDAAIEPLVDNLTKDPEGDVRISVTKALANLSPAKVTQPLIHCLENDGYPDLNYAADDMEFGPSFEVQRCALDALGQTGSAEAVAPVMRVIQDNGLEDLQEQGFRVLAQLDRGAAIAFLMQQLQQGGRLVRRRAARALVLWAEATHHSVPENTIQTLQAALADHEASVRIYVARALLKLDQRNSKEAVIALLNDPNLEVRKEIATLLGNVGGDEEATLLHPLLQVPDYDLRTRVIAVLGIIGSASSHEPVATLLDSNDADLLFEVVRTLGSIGQPGVENRLAEILADENMHPETRAQAARSLGLILKNSPSTEPLAEPLAKTNPKPAQSDEESLPEKNERATAPIEPLQQLEQAVFDPAATIGIAALTALLEINTGTAEERLLQLLRHGAPPKKAGNLGGNGPEENGPEENGPEENRPEENGPKPALHEDHDSTSAETTPATENHGTVEKEAGKETNMTKTASLETGDPTQSTLAAILAGFPDSSVTTEPQPEEPVSIGPSDDPVDKRVRLYAARLLGSIQLYHHKSILALMEVAEIAESLNSELRQAAIVSLGNLGDPRALPVLIRAVTAEHHHIRLAALEALQGFPSYHNDPEMLHMLLKDPDPAIRQQVVRLLSSLQETAFDEAMLTALEDEEQIVAETALHVVQPETSSPTLINHISGVAFRYSGELRTMVGATLRRLGDVTQVEPYLATLNNPEKEEFHWICIDVLAEIFATERTAKN